MEATLQIAPPPWATIWRSSCCMHRNTPCRLTAMVRCQLSHDTSVTLRPSPPTPALLNAQSSRP